MSCTLYHNPQCSKSRAALQWLQENNMDVDVIEYLKTPPSCAEIKTICTMLNKHPREITRYNNSIAKELNLQNKNDQPLEEWFTLLHENPALIERPICIANKQAAIGRPLQAIIELF